MKIEVELVNGEELEFEHSITENEVNFVKKTDQGDEELSEDLINYSMFDELNFHADMSEEDILDSVQKAIGSLDFLNIEVQFELEDGSEIVYDFEKQSEFGEDDDENDEDDNDDVNEDVAGVDQPIFIREEE